MKIVKALLKRCNTVFPEFYQDPASLSECLNTGSVPIHVCILAWPASFHTIFRSRNWCITCPWFHWTEHSQDRSVIALYNSIEETVQQQRILPSMKFSCSGNISKWTFVARSQTGGGDQYPLFQLWRPSGTRRYVRVYESSDMSTMSGQSEFTVEEYIPPDPVPFEAGDIFGVYQPQEPRRRLSVVHVDVPPGYGYTNYYITNVMMSLEEFDTDGRGSTVGNNYPLVAVETSEYQKTLSDKQSCQPLSKISVRYRAANTARVHAYQCAS